MSTLQEIKAIISACIELHDKEEVIYRRQLHALDTLERELAEAKADAHAANQLAADRLADLNAQEEQHSRTFAALVNARAAAIELAVSAENRFTARTAELDGADGVIANLKAELVRKDEALAKLKFVPAWLYKVNTATGDCAFHLEPNEVPKNMGNGLLCFTEAADLAQGGKVST